MEGGEGRGWSKRIGQGEEQERQQSGRKGRKAVSMLIL
jgi:hypothetical protein